MWGWLSGNWDFAPPLWSGLLQDAEGGSLVKTGDIGLRKVHVSSLCCWFLVEAVRSAASRFQLLCFPFRHLKYSYMWSGRHGCLLLSVRLSVITSILLSFIKTMGKTSSWLIWESKRLVLFAAKVFVYQLFFSFCFCFCCSFCVFWNIVKAPFWWIACIGLYILWVVFPVGDRNS